MMKWGTTGISYSVWRTSILALFCIVKIMITIQIDTTGNQCKSQIGQVEQQQQHGIWYTYSREKLIELKFRTLHNNNLRILPVDLCYLIRKLRITKSRKRGKTALKDNLQLKLHKGGSNHSNLIQINLIPNQQRIENINIRHFKFFVSNVRSMKGKELLIREYMDEGKFDFGIFTETWLEEKDQQWIEGCALNNHGYRLVHHDRKHKRGGGIALTYKEWIKAKHIDCGEKDTFEFLSAHFTLCTTTITILCIYHPPASAVNQTSNSRFIDEFLEFLTTFVPAHDNILIGGDFNLHIGDKHDLDAEVFSESMESLGFIQHVKFETHNKGNVLDLIMTEEHSSVKIKECNPGPFLSDHCCIEVDCSTKKRQCYFRNDYL